MKYAGLIILLIMTLFSCKEGEDQSVIDEEIIVNYMADNEIEAVPTGSGLYYLEITEGSGAQPNSNSTVKVDYTGYFTNGNPFDLSGPEGIDLSLNQVIAGWQEGIPLMREGGEATLLIPSGLAYGTQQRGSIPPNSVLIFDIKLLEVL